MKLDTLNIGKYLTASILADSTLTGLIGNKIYPCVADNDATYPFVIYKRINCNCDGNKDGFVQDNVTVEFTVVSDKYSVGITIAQRLRELFEVEGATSGNMCIYNCHLTLGSETYNGAYVQQLQFSAQVERNYNN